MTPSSASQPTSQPPERSPATPPAPYEAPTLTLLGAWTAVTLNISIPVGLSNVYNDSPFDTEF